MALYERQFSDDLDIADAPSPSATLLIASSPRCGSHMLGHSLAETGRLGVPFEYANPVNLAGWAEQGLGDGRTGPARNVAILKALMDRRTTPGGVFGLKMHYTHLAALGGARETLSLLPAPRIVRIVRRDLVRQAFSYARAMQTGIWIDGQTGTGAATRYDRAQIDRCLADLAWQHAGWEAVMAEAGLPVLRVDFETLRADLPGEIRRILRFMDVDPDDVAVPDVPPTRSQGGAQGADDWMARYAATPPAPQPRSLPRRIIRRLRRVSGR